MEPQKGKGQKLQRSESMQLGFILTLAGGFQDAYSYNCRDQVFANAQTGNIVLLGQNLAMGNFGTALRYLLPVLMFVAGVYLAERLRNHFRYSGRLHWRQGIVLLEAMLLVITGFMPQEWNGMANAFMSFACAMQVTSFRKIRSLPCATTMCIGNLRSGAELLCKYHITKERESKRQSLQYFTIIGIFALGAALGGLATKGLREHAIWVAAVLLGLGFVSMHPKRVL